MEKRRFKTLMNTEEAEDYATRYRRYGNHQERVSRVRKSIDAGNETHTVKFTFKELRTVMYLPVFWKDGKYAHYDDII